MKTKVLILGGSHFIGRNLVESLMANDEFHLELFNRGKTNHGLFPGLEVNIGDRNDKEQEALKKGEWDITPTKLDIYIKPPASR